MELRKQRKELLSYSVALSERRGENEGGDRIYSAFF